MMSDENPYVTIADPARYATTFSMNHNTEVMRIDPDGRFFIKGREVETDQEIRDVFAAWCRECLGNQVDRLNEVSALHAEVARLRAALNWVARNDRDADSAAVRAKVREALKRH